MNRNDSTESEDIGLFQSDEEEVDPIKDIIDYLVRCAKISFKNSHIDEKEVKTSERVQMACALFKKSPTDFLIQFGKYLAPYHIDYFENLKCEQSYRFRDCVAQLKIYHSEESKHKRIRNRRYKALQKLQNESDYFSEKQMMSRNPVLYEQLIGQFLTDEEIRERDGVDRENITFLDLILETVDRNEMREIKNEQMLEEDLDSMAIDDETSNQTKIPEKKKQWGEFVTVDTTPTFKPEIRKQAMISAPERILLKEEFLQEMYSSFIEGRDDVDYNIIDNDEQLDDLEQLSQDAEDKYFDSESNEVESLEEHMALVEEYGKKQLNDNTEDDPLDVFMTHITNKATVYSYFFVLIKNVVVLICEKSIY